jgi:phosphopantothenoylcysteine decarboxylase/phosphopantothenate--cysteine ligase
MNPFRNRRILLAVSGSIAAYKAVDLASKLRQSGAEVDVVLSEAARQFVTPLTFQSVTGRPAFTDADLWGDAGHVLHIGLAEGADLMVVAPATANTLARLAHGLSDNLLTVSALANRAPLLLAPAMDGGMWEHPATQANVETLRDRGALFVGPESGHLASGQQAVGRMAEPADILGAIRQALGSGGPLDGVDVVVSAGGTQEAIDPVRRITNRSSGKQGFALAQAALDLGANVTLIAAPAGLPTPYGARRHDVTSAEEMLAAVQNASRQADVLVMAAAVADFRPASIAADKLKKGDGVPQIELEPTPDILAAIGLQRGVENILKVVVGFAAESRDLIANAQAKMESKHLDLIVANDISANDAGFGVDSNRVTLLFAGGRQETLPLMGKDEVAAHVMAAVAELLEHKA